MCQILTGYFFLLFVSFFYLFLQVVLYLGKTHLISIQYKGLYLYKDLVLLVRIIIIIKKKLERSEVILAV